MGAGLIPGDPVGGDALRGRNIRWNIRGSNMEECARW
jgi:hypothetical protein